MAAHLERGISAKGAVVFFVRSAIVHEHVAVALGVQRVPARQFALHMERHQVFHADGTRLDVFLGDFAVVFLNFTVSVDAHARQLGVCHL